MFNKSITQYGKIPWNNRRYIGKMYEYNTELGYSPISNSVSQEISIYKNKPIDIIFDNNGFRIYKGYSKNKEKKTILFIGDSFTFGDLCPAESSFVYIVAKILDMNVINAGVQGYGIAHNLILAEKLIKKYKPDYVIVQYSEHMAYRATQYYAPHGPRFQGFVSVPYIAKKKNNFIIVSPIFRTKIFDMNIAGYYDNRNFIKFLINIAFPLYLYDDYNAIIKPYCLWMFGIKNRPHKNIDEIIYFVYNRISEIANKYNSKFYILSINNDNSILNDTHIIYSIENAKIINADSVLWEYENIKDFESYYEIYGHISDNGELYDKHPNIYAHCVIAQSIINSIKLFDINTEGLKED